MSDVYVSPDIAAAQDGTKDSPTTITDALTKVANNGTIHLLYGTNGTYNIEKVIGINATTTQAGINAFSMTAENPVIFEANQNRILSIRRGYNITLANVTFTGGYMDYGGAIYNAGNLTIAGSVFANSSTRFYGGAIYNTGNSNVTNTTFINNTASSGGGAIYNTGNSNAANNIFINNTAGTGNAIYSTKAFADENSTLYGNQTVFELDREDNTLFVKVNINNYSNNYAADMNGILNIYNKGTLLYTNNSYAAGTTASLDLSRLGHGLYNFTISFTSEENGLTNLSTVQEVATKLNAMLAIEAGPTKINKATLINLTLED